jgi:hypothetical protein
MAGMADANKPLDFTASNCAVLPVDVADRPDGDILYQPRISYGEQYTVNNGSYQQTQVAVAWSDANDFIDFALGYAEWDRAETSRFHRVLPMVSPYQSTMYCESVSMADFAMFRGSLRQADDLNKWLEADFAFYDLVFRPRLYDLLTDAQVDGSDYPWAAHGCKELGRYVTRWAHPRTEELKLGTYKLEAQNPSTSAWSSIPDPGFVPVFSIDVLYTWHCVPYDAVPIDAIAACGAKVNDAAFDKKRNVADTLWVDMWPEGTLLFKGTSDRLQPYSGPNGELLVDVPYRFEYKPNGWNKFPPPGGTGAWWPVRRKDGGGPLYDEADFKTLFKPRTS